jgi:hypothetical protein
MVVQSDDVGTATGEVPLMPQELCHSKAGTYSAWLLMMP